MKVQAVPQGLQTLLDIPGGGPVPQELSPILFGVIDITPRYLARLLSTETAGPTALAGLKDQGVTLAVPQGESWDVISVNFTTIWPGAALKPCLELNINGACVAFLDNDDVARANPFEASVCYTPNGALVLSPGHTMSGFIRSTPNAASTGIVRALVRKVRV